MINGGNKLFGQFEVGGCKNAVLPILAGTILCDGEILLKNCPELSDVFCMMEILGVLGINCHFENKEFYINTKNIQNAKIDHTLTHKLRASIFLLGPLLSRFRKAVIAFPGGCNIGARPIDIHLKGFRTLGVKVSERHGYLFCDASNMKAGEVFLDFPSVGATESIMMSACLLEGTTTLRNCAKEPEIVDLQNFLNKMGAKISGAGTDCITVEGVKALHGGEYMIMPDRIVAGTILLAAATCGGDVEIKNFGFNDSLVAFLKQTACQIDLKGDTIRLKAEKRLLSLPKIETLPYPFFPTDLQPQMMVLQSVSKGVCLVCENLFENRFLLIPELKKMGADIIVKDKVACVVGVEKLFGADVFASDLRAGAALVIAGMKAEGYTTVHNVGFIDRGYEKIENMFGCLGADIKRIQN